MMNKQLYDLIEIINDTADLMNGGRRTEHQAVEIKEVRRFTAAQTGFSAEAVGHGKPASAAKPGPAAMNSGVESIETIAAEIHACTACGLHASRTNAVPGAGSANRPSVMFIGEGPGADEDRTGIPFVGKAGQYLDKWLAAIGLDRESSCFIGNIIKCRPPGNRDPQPDEIAACRPFLIRQLNVIKPKMIITLGRFASQVICASEDGIGKLRSRTHFYEGIPVVPTYHPSAVLRNPDYRGDVWDDLKRAREILNGIEQGS